jgi:hypothetical protein
LVAAVAGVNGGAVARDATGEIVARGEIAVRNPSNSHKAVSHKVRRMSGSVFS